MDMSDRGKKSVNQVKSITSGYLDGFLLALKQLKETFTSSKSNKVHNEQTAHSRLDSGVSMDKS